MRALPFAGRLTLDDRKLAILLLVPAIVLIGAFEFYPLLLAMRDSLYQIDLTAGTEQFVGLDNFSSVLLSTDTAEAAVRSLEFIVGSLVIQTTLGLVTALLLDRGLRGQNLWRGLTLVPYMVPAIVTSLVFRFGFNQVYGAIDYLLVSTHMVSQPIPFLDDPNTIMLVVVLVSSWRHTPFMTIVLLARLQTVRRELIEAARVDGAGQLSIFRHVILPWLMPVLVIAMLLRTIWAAVEFDFPYLTAFGGPLKASTVVPIQIYVMYTQQLDVGRASALALCVGVVLFGASMGYLTIYRRLERSAA